MTKPLLDEPGIRPGTVEVRPYQDQLTEAAWAHDHLVVLPTGLGKTILAARVFARAWQQGAKRLVLVAPTKPLCEQHAKSLQTLLDEEIGTHVHAVTGSLRPSKREELYGGRSILCCTPQVLQNDILHGMLDDGVDWIVYDEAHRTSGDYPYAFLASHLLKVKPDHRRMALTASPGADAKRVFALLEALGLRNVEVRVDTDPDVSPYIHETQVLWETLPLPAQAQRVNQRLEAMMQDRVRKLRDLKVWKGVGPGKPSKRALLDLQSELQRRLKATQGRPDLYQGLSLQAQCMKLHFASELATTQGLQAFRMWVEKLQNTVESGEKSSKADQALLRDPRLMQAYTIAGLDREEDPKLDRIHQLVSDALLESPDRKILLFANYRATGEVILESLAPMPQVRGLVFTGQSKRGDTKGMTQKEQQAAIEQFRSGEVNVLIATSVAEEGLDVPGADLVIFYEPLASEIRTIQRRGRTGRHEEGRVHVLMTKGTADEAAYWSAKRKEEEMVRQLQTLRRSLSARSPSTPMREPGRPSLDQFQSTTSSERAAARPVGQGPRVVVDKREGASSVVTKLFDAGANLEHRTLDVGDYIVSDRVLIERKTLSDLEASLLDGRLWDQIKAMQAYPKPVMILEGEGVPTRIAPEAYWGTLATVAQDFGVSLLRTLSSAETAQAILSIAKREQNREGRSIAIRHAPAPKDPQEQPVYILAGFPGIEDKLARRLLQHFGTLRGVLSASLEDLQAVEGIGPEKAQTLLTLLDARFGA